MINAAIIGASGYTGSECARLLACHPRATLSAITSRTHAGKRFDEMFGHLRGHLDLAFEEFEPAALAERAEIFFCAVPHASAMHIVPQLLAAGKKVIDLSADFRLRDQQTYETWYQPHTAPRLLDQAVYGLPELYGKEIGSAKLVANPGCYPTSAILGLTPALRHGLVDSDGIIIDAKSGISGAGRGVSLAALFAENHGGFQAYKIGGKHRHIPEIEQELSKAAGRNLRVSFTPHLLPVSRGILSTIYAPLNDAISDEQLFDIYQSFYGECYFVRVLPPGRTPSIQHVRGSNFCDIGLAVDRRTNRLIITAAIDNLVKGAAGQAIQNMNLMCGLDESAGLSQVALFP
jgi:N-acetyl-gamma-glutamyl-phosphate reductase